MSATTPTDEELLKSMLAEFGATTGETVKAVLGAVGGKKNMQRLADLWFDHHLCEGTFILFGTAVSFGFNIGRRIATGEARE